MSGDDATQTQVPGVTQLGGGLIIRTFFVLTAWYVSWFALPFLELRGVMLLDDCLLRFELLLSLSLETLSR